MGDILRVFVIVAGVYMFLKAILSLAKRKMTEPFCLAWAFLAALMVLAGILLNPVQLDNFIRGLILVILVISGLLWDLWFISSQVSILKRRNQELAMQISLLNQDCEKILKELEELRKEQ